MIIREARTADATAIARLHAESWRVAYRGALSDAFLDGDVFADRLQVWRQRLLSPANKQHVLVAEEDREATGFVCAYGADDPQWGTLLDNLHVSQPNWGRGIGQRLMAEVASLGAKAYPGKGMYLWVLAPNVPARRFYERLGATNAGQEQWGAPGGGTVQRLRYVWANLEPLISLIARGSSWSPSQC